MLISKDRRPEGQYAKLRQRMYGACRVLERINHNAYEIELPSTCLSPIFSMCCTLLLTMIQRRPRVIDGQVLSKKIILMREHFLSYFKMSLF